jgi:5-methylcytosine-specific restriction endonuclease McrA
MMGENHPNWNGGVSSIYRRVRKLTKYVKWRTFCFERDDYTCQWCNKKGTGDLNVDHIKPFALIVKEHNIKTTFQAQNCDELWDIKNGRTLCEDCHKTTSTWGNGTRKLLNACK